VVVVVALLVVFVWKPFSGPQERDLNNTDRGYSVTIPDGWHSEVPDGDPTMLFIAWNGHAQHPNSDPIDCAVERREFKANVYVRLRGPFDEQEPNRQPGARFDDSSGGGLVGNTDGHVCGERIQVWNWEENGRQLQAGIRVGADGASSLPDAYEILNSLHVDVKR
jgi:hypothetical protein